MTLVYDFHQIGRLPAPGDNVAIAVRRLAAGTRITFEGLEFALDSPVLEGHRFAVRPIAPGQALLSWGLPFGVALRPIAPGGYVCNAAMLQALRGRTLDFDPPSDPNFSDAPEAYALNEAAFRPGAQVAPYTEARHFLGYRRGGGRGVGTRNFIVLLGVTSRAGGYVRRLAAQLQGRVGGYGNVSGIVPVAHTEGGLAHEPNNLEIVLRTLAGFVVHPNVGAVLIVEGGPDALTNDRLRAYLNAHHSPLDSVPHHFLSLAGDFQLDLAHGAAIVEGWLESVNAGPRTEESLAHLSLALQCGGSDAFSGISGNPLAGAVAAEVLRYGGRANLAETDELTGAEPYVLQNVRDLDTARAFLARLERFKEQLAWHGVTPEGNTSGGNRYRGLYNNALKSIGAARKRDPQVRLDGVIDYAAPLPAPGFYFMDSPGNDLESIAGQVASGANLIFFVTGNGSITNFPFVPTIKIVTTTGRYNLLPGEMDVNAGAYLDGTPLADLTRQALDLAVRVASGDLSRGERAGHSQVSIWRNWQQTGRGRVNALLAAPPSAGGRPIPIDTSDRLAGEFHFEARGGSRRGRVGLILPVSLCAGQIARLAAERLNAAAEGGRERGLERFAALVHTEGCGVSGHSAYTLYPRVVLNYMAHPLVGSGLFLEHGCEKTHNDYMRRQMEDLGRDPSRYGWASIQLDGGLDKVLAKIEAWFAEASAGQAAPQTESAGLDRLRLGLHAPGPLPAPAALALARLARTVVGAGGTVVLPQTSTALLAELKTSEVSKTSEASLPHPSLAFGQIAAQPGFHVMETPTEHGVETLTGLGATGVEVILAYTGAGLLAAHPLVPVLQVAVGDFASPDLDLRLAGDETAWAEALLRLVLDAASGRYVPRLMSQGNVDFQITRGLLGVST